MTISGGALRSAIDLDRSDMVAPVSRADLAIGMQLLRASNMKALRLQLAVMRSDRQMIADAVDSLVELDGEIASFLADMPAADVAMREMDEIGRWIEQQKNAVAAEKHMISRVAEGPGFKRPSATEAGTEDATVHAAEDPDAAELELDGYELAEEAGSVQRSSLALRQEAARDDTIRLSPAELKRLAADANGQQLRMAVAHIDRRMRRIPGRGFVFATVLAVQALIGGIIIYGDLYSETVKRFLQFSF